MILPKTFRSHQIRALFNLQNPSLLYPINPKLNTETHLIPPISSKSCEPISIFIRNISLSALFLTKSDNVRKNFEKPKKPLDTLFAEAVGSSENLQKIYIEDGDTETGELKKRMRKLESKLRRDYEETDIDECENGNQDLKITLRKDRADSEKESKTLSVLFMNKYQIDRSRKELRKVDEGLMNFRELSPDMAAFANYLHRKGYLMNANFSPNNKFDVSCFENSYGRDFLKFAAEKFARDHREIGKWLPGRDLKKVAQYGCPSLGRKNVFSAKLMRNFYGIQEQTVCSKCMLKQSCKFANQNIWQKGAKNMDLTVVMRVITLYALDVVSRPLEVPDDVKGAASRLLKEVIRLSQLDS